MKLAPNFTSHELCRSKRFPARSSKFEQLSPILAANLTRLVVEFLQPVRDRFGKTEILSGYRNLLLNNAVGGAAKSRHMRGLAADWIPRQADVLEVWRWLVLTRHRSQVNFDRLTLYTTLDPMTLHVDLREWEQGPQRLRLFRGSPWQELETREALDI